MQTQGCAHAAQPQGSSSRAQDYTATAQNGLVMTKVKWRDAQVWKRKWTLERSRFAAEYFGIEEGIPALILE